MTNTIPERDVRESLRKSSLRPEHIEAAVSSMKRGGLISSDDALHASAAPQIRTLSAAAAENINNRTLVRQVLGQARHLGVEIDPDKMISPFELSEMLRAKGVGPTERFRLKANLAALRVIE